MAITFEAWLKLKDLIVNESNREELEEMYNRALNNDEWIISMDWLNSNEE